jgi:hypothetical protein
MITGEGKDKGNSSTQRGQDVSRKGRLEVSFEAYSFLLFCALSLSAIALFSGFYLLFVIIVTVDGLATLTNSDSVVSADRSIFFLALLILSVVRGSYNLFFLFLEIILVIAALDISFLLRRLQGTVVDVSVIRGRLESYAYTLVPAFLLSYSLTYLYSFISGFSSPEPLVLLAVSSAAALFAIYAVSRYLSSPAIDRR